MAQLYTLIALAFLAGCMAAPERRASSMPAYYIPECGQAQPNAPCRHRDMSKPKSNCEKRFGDICNRKENR